MAVARADAIVSSLRAALRAIWPAGWHGIACFIGQFSVHGSQAYPFPLPIRDKHGIIARAGQTVRNHATCAEGRWLSLSARGMGNARRISPAGVLGVRKCSVAYFGSSAVSPST